MSGLIAAPSTRSPSRRRAAVLHNPSLMVGLAILAVVVAVAVTAPWVFPGDPQDMVASPELWPGQDPAFPLGTDSLGRDVAAGLAHGARVPLLVGTSAATIGLAIGTLVGALDGLRRQLAMAVLLITHDLGVVAQWADRVAVMYAGRVVEKAPVGEFFAQPRHPYAQGLLEAAVGEGEAHCTTIRLTEIAGSVASAAGEPGCSFAPRCPKRIPDCSLQPPPMQPAGSNRQVACIVETFQAEVSHAAAVG